MSAIEAEDVKQLDLADNSSVEQQEDSPCGQEPKDPEIKEENAMPSPRQEEEVIKKKYGGLLLKKPPLISKDHERAYFDSADWALGKQGAQKNKGPSEALLPKWQPTPHQQARPKRLAYAATDGDAHGDNNDDDNDATHEDQSSIEDGCNNDIPNSDVQICCK